jgi:hypothetical protein
VDVTGAVSCPVNGLVALVVLDLQAVLLLCQLFILTGKHMAGSNLRPQL